MESSAFRLSPTRCCPIRVGSWNIHAIHDKLENAQVVRWIHQHDVIFLYELRSNSSFTVPGFHVYMNAERRGGGIAVLIRNQIISTVTKIDLTIYNQCWLEMKCLPGIAIAGCYFPPPDSPYHSLEDIARLQCRIIDSNKLCLLVGDLNARCGLEIKKILPSGTSWSYSQLPDPVPHPKSNGRTIIRMCQDLNAVVVNNLHTENKTFPGALTFRKRNRWISELDLCVASIQLIPALENLTFDSSERLPSDHAPMSVALNPEQLGKNWDTLKSRAASLGQHAVGLIPKERRLCKKPIPYSRVHSADFENALQNLEPPTNTDLMDALHSFTEVLYDNAKNHPKQEETFDENRRRWNRILASNDPRLLWKAINWKGGLDRLADHCEVSDDQFRQHFELLLNPDQLQQLDFRDALTSDMYVPLLDDDIQPLEIAYIIQNQLKSNSGCGPDGVSPGLFKHLSPNWFFLLNEMMNRIFHSQYPFVFAQAKMFMIFKKGARNQADNYRGISVMNSIAKIYDYILCNRLTKWFIPDREQAGAQAGRSCLDHIITLRLLISYAASKKKPLYIAFVDFSKAYDRIPRDKLIQSLRELGCGSRMLSAIASMYRVSYGVMGSTLMTFLFGVRQGAPTSCFLFTLYVNEMIRLMKQKCDDDDFLGAIHVLLLMDDTCIVATTRDKCLQKLSVMLEFCQQRDIKVNESKTTFMVVNSNDRAPLVVRGQGETLTIQYCPTYVYLGAHFVDDAKMSSVISRHVETKANQLIKFVNFVSKNRDAPYAVKKKVLDSAFISSIFYSCESWLDCNLDQLNTMYLPALKALLNVRKTTPNLLCLAEAGYPYCKSWIKERQRKFFQNIFKRDVNQSDPLMFAINLHLNARSKIGNVIMNLRNCRENLFVEGMNDIKQTVQGSNASKCITYVTMNPDFVVHNVYSPQSDVPEFARVAFTRLRLSAHNLRIETGRWARIPRDQRLCQCGEVQTEEHVICHCVLSAHVRNHFDHLNFTFPYFFFSDNLLDVAMCTHEIVSLY